MKSLDGYRILLVEDEFMILLDLQHILESEGAVVDTAMSVAEGLKAADGEFDAAVLDVRLPDGDVFPVAERLFERHVPLLFHSGHLKAEHVATDFPSSVALKKPVNEAVLINAIVAQASAAQGR